jgi:hypothetical protein
MGHIVHERQPAGPVACGYPGPLDAGLSGTGLVADDLYLLAHDDRTGKPLLPPRPLGTGLAGALLAEVMLAGCIGLRSDTAVVIGCDGSPAVMYGHVLLKQIAEEPGPLRVRAWLRYLARTAVRDIAHRLERAGYLTRCRSRLPGRSPIRANGCRPCTPSPPTSPRRDVQARQPAASPRGAGAPVRSDRRRGHASTR